MLGKRSRPAIGKLAGVLRSGIIDTMTSPRSPLDCRSLFSPRGLKSNNSNYYDKYGGIGIGLGIVVALENNNNNNNNKSSNKTCNVVECGGEILAKYAICSQFSTRSSPINVTSSSSSRKIKNEINNHNGVLRHDQQEEEEMIEGFDEEFTYVTCRGPNKSTTTVYYSGDEQRPKISKKIGVFNISSPARFSGDCRRDSDSDFLSSCHSCRKGLHGKDIYMYS
ncbi:hypothetical protein SOVF_192890 [Spinacia oleracea]|nr:hypothetical protein SOVF_192890 [Spinacia oleracea]